VFGEIILTERAISIISRTIAIGIPANHHTAIDITGIITSIIGTINRSICLLLII
jgi:hypothetical protein